MTGQQRRALAEIADQARYALLTQDKAPQALNAKWVLDRCRAALAVREEPQEERFIVRKGTFIVRKGTVVYTVPNGAAYPLDKDVEVPLAAREEATPKGEEPGSSYHNPIHVSNEEIAQRMAAREDTERFFTPEQFYERAAWPVGKLVADVRDPSCIGTIVKRGGRQWASRDKLPMVRWHGKLSAEAVEWARLIKAAAREDTERPDRTAIREIGTANIAYCPEHGLHGERETCFTCGLPVIQVPMRPVEYERGRPSAPSERKDAEAQLAESVRDTERPDELGEFIAAADWLVRCLQDVIQSKVVRGLPEAEGAYHRTRAALVMRDTEQEPGR